MHWPLTNTLDEHIRVKPGDGNATVTAEKADKGHIRFTITRDPAKNPDKAREGWLTVFSDAGFVAECAVAAETSAEQVAYRFDLASGAVKHSHFVLREYRPSNDGEPPQVSVGKQKLMQILVNLISNAKDAILESPSGRSRITLKVSQGDHDSVFIDVCDTGVGIPEEHLAAIFAHGFTTKQQRGGHGFGLHHSANAATELDGHLTATSDGIGTGAVFRLQLPLKHAATSCSTRLPNRKT